MATLLSRGEAKDLDFKGPMRWDPTGDKGACCALVKDILAMANTLGGRLVVGVEEARAGFRPTGLDQNALATWDSTSVNQFLGRYADPPINTTLLKAKHLGCHFVVIDVPSFPNLPHICVKDYPGILRRPAIYMRSDNNESAEVAASADLSGIVEQAIRNRSTLMLQQFRAILSGADLHQTPDDARWFEEQLAAAVARFEELYPTGLASFPDPRVGYIQVATWPARFAHDRFTFDKLTDSSQRANLDYGNHYGLLWPRSYTIQDGLEATKWLGTSGRFYFWRLLSSGFLFHRQVMPEDIDYGYPTKPAAPGEFLSIPRLVAFVAAAIDCAGIVYRDLSIADEDITIRFELIQTQGRRLRGPSNSSLEAMDLASRIATVTKQRTESLEEWVSNQVDLTHDLAGDLMKRFNWPSAYYPKAFIEDLFARRSRPGRSGW